MTGEESNAKTGLRLGLPAFLVEDPERLNDLLGLNREQRRRIVSLVPKPARKAIKEDMADEVGSPLPGELDRRLIAWQYADPSFRRMLWEHLMREGPGYATSLESLILGDLMEPPAGENDSRPGEASDWRAKSERIIQAAWSHTRERLEEWDYLAERARVTCLMRAFAVATLRGDPGILIEAVRMVPALGYQFEEILGEDAPAPPSHEEPEILREWRERCAALVKFSVRAEGPPAEPSLVDEMAAAVESLREIAPRVEVETKAEIIEDFVETIRVMLNELRADESFFAWLDKQMQAALLDRWIAHAASLTRKQIRDEWKRIRAGAEQVERDVREAFENATLAEQRVFDAREERSRSGFEGRAQVASLAEVQAEERAAEAALADAQAALLTLFSPGDEPHGRSPSEEAAPDEAAPSL